MKKKISLVLVALVLIFSMAVFSSVKSEASEKRQDQVETSVENNEKTEEVAENDSENYSTGEILKKSGLNTVLGMGIVFAVLIFLALIIGLLKYVPGHQTEKTVEIQKPEEVPVMTSVQEINDLELVAVITAAIAAKEGTSSNGFVVRSIRRRPSNRW